MVVSSSSIYDPCGTPKTTRYKLTKPLKEDRVDIVGMEFDFIQQESHDVEQRIEEIPHFPV